MSVDFHGELSIEPIVGVRVFQVDAKGRLRGVTHTDIWRPGENVAVCHARGPELPPAPSPARDLDGLYFAYTRSYSPPSYVDFYDPLGTAKSQRRSARKRDKERAAAEAQDKERVALWKEQCTRIEAEWETHGLDKCDHGFWAFYEPDAGYHNADRIYGVVEGYGEVVVGTKGFRASKARIVALSLPATTSELLGYQYTLVGRNYPDVPTYPSLARMLSEHALSRNPEPDAEGFWDEAPPVKVEDSYSAYSAVIAQLTRSMAFPSHWSIGGAS